MINNNMINQDQENKKSAKELLQEAEGGKGVGQRFEHEKTEYVEKEISAEEKLIREEVSRELKLMEQDEDLKKESENKAKKIQYLGDEEKLENLLKIAKDKGVVFAVKVAKNMNDPYILDTFHDLLVKEGLWKNLKQ